MSSVQATKCKVEITSPNSQKAVWLSESDLQALVERLDEAVRRIEADALTRKLNYPER
jgi:PHD/YefM family antitoxin component YafN of YafNO toxin-antitoxin module